MRKFFAELVAGYIFEKGVDSLVDFLRQNYPVTPTLSDNDRNVIKHFQSSVPNTYQRVGILFEVYVVESQDGSPQTVVIPRSFGENPTGAIVNEAVFSDKDLPELPADVQREWAERRAKITELASGGASVDRRGLWWELDRTSRNWSVRHADLVQAEDQAKRWIANAESLSDMSRAAPTINALRANAAVWLDLRQQAETRIRDEVTRSRIQALVDANARMVSQIDDALKDLKRAQEYQGFLNTLNLVGSVFKLGAQFSDTNDASNARMIALENRSITYIEKAGNEMRRLDLELKNVFGGYVISPDIMPSFEVRMIGEIIDPEGKWKGK